MTRPRLMETSLGPVLVHDDDVWTLDLGGLPILHGLSVLSRALAELVAAELRGDCFDLAVERQLNQREHPELIETFGIDVVRLSADPEVLQQIEQEPEAFEWRLRAVFGSLQRQRFRDALLPADRRQSRPLLAEFGRGGARQRYLLEHLSGHRGHRAALRLRIGAGDRPTAADAVSIGDASDRHFIAGSTRIALTWTEAIRREAERGRRSLFESRSPHSHLFRQLDQADLGTVQRVVLQWSDSALPFLLESEPTEVSRLLKRVLLACEDANVRQLLAAREVVRVDAGAVPVFLDMAQLGRVLELSIGQQREQADVEAFLARMPVLGNAVARAAADQPLAGVRLFLVHHVTAEVIGLIGALRRLGCRDLVCVFISYAGEPPASYLDALLDLPADEFRCLSLANVPTRGHIEGHYRLSAHYSELDEADAIRAALVGRDRAYLPAMRAAAMVPFLAQLERAAAAGERLLLVEDGGYLGPMLHDAALRGLTLAAFAAEAGHQSADERPLASALLPHLVATVEHTRNGFDRLTEVEAKHGRLALPAYSIAISRLKVATESREVAASILNAVESVLHADGRILSRRHCLVLGSRGAIGSELWRGLGARIAAPETTLSGVDLKVAAPTADGREAAALTALDPQRWLDTDLVIGVTGTSVLTAGDLERWLVHGQRDALILASGSTKKVEFAALMRWFDDLSAAAEPTVGGEPVEVAVHELLDPRTARVYGHRWQFLFRARPRRRMVLALGNLTPINFLFYGVATELIDEVLAQLLRLSLGALRTGRGDGAAPRLLAVDRDVDDDGQPLG